MLKKLASVAGSLDEKGFEHLANQVDTVLVRLAQPIIVQNIKDDLSQVFQQNLVINTSNRGTLNGLVPVYNIDIPNKGLSFEAVIESDTQQLAWTVRIDKEQAPPIAFLNKVTDVFKKRNMDYKVDYKEPAELDLSGNGKVT